MANPEVNNTTKKCIVVAMLHTYFQTKLFKLLSNFLKFCNYIHTILSIIAIIFKRYREQMAPNEPMPIWDVMRLSEAFPWKQTMARSSVKRWVGGGTGILGISVLSGSLLNHRYPVILIGTHKEKGATMFWMIVRTQLPLQGHPITCWKFCHMLHKILREGYPQVRDVYQNVVVYTMPLLIMFTKSMCVTGFRASSLNTVY